MIIVLMKVDRFLTVPLGIFFLNTTSSYITNTPNVSISTKLNIMSRNVNDHIFLTD